MTARTQLRTIPRWQWALAGSAFVSATLVLLLAAYATAWWLWCLAGLAVGGALWRIEEQTPALDRQRPLPHAIATGTKLVCAVLLIVGFTQANAAFASIFVVLPLIATRLVYPGTRPYWLYACGAASAALALTDLPTPLVIAITLLSLLAAFWGAYTAAPTTLSAWAPIATGKPRRGRALEHADEFTRHSADELTLETIHRLLTTARAATRSRFAGILWTQNDSHEARVGVAESTRPRDVHDLSLPLSSFFDDHSLATSGIFEIERDCPAPWYNAIEPSDTRYLVAPLLDEGIVLGALVIERAKSQPAFGHAEITVAEHSAAIIVQALRTEQILTQAARSQRDLQLMARSADALRETLTRQEVFSVAHELLEEMLGDISTAVVECTNDDELRIVSTGGLWPHALHERDIPLQQSLVGLAIQRRHVLPYRVQCAPDDPHVFGPNLRMDADPSLLIVPMVSGGKTIGALVMRSDVAHVFTPLVRERMQLLTNQVAAALANAQAYESMVVRATTDGMTQLLNHATFREQYANTVARATRNRRPLSVLLLDIDHFKRVNDTWGHATGDDVIRGVAAVIRAEVRKVDLAARYGGEEFCIALEDTSQEGALQFAERLRKKVEALVFNAQDSTLRVTISIGVCIAPDHGESAQQLIEQADAALYVSKKSGRNRVSLWSPPDLKELVA